MARYSALLGRPVEVQYRAGDICLPASGTLVGDSGRSIFLEQHFEQQGQAKNFRWEIPYPCIVRLEESDTSPVLAPENVISAHPFNLSSEENLQASAAHASGSSSPVPIVRSRNTA